LASYTNQEKTDKEEELEKLAVEKQRGLDEFDRQNNSAVPHQQAAGHPDDRHVFHGANSVRVTSYEEEALRTMKAFWLPSATPEAVERVHAPSFETCCPEGNEKLKLKDLFPVVFTDLPHSGEKQEVDVDGSKFMCPSCSVTLTNTLTLVAVSACGHVFCKKCADQFIAPGKECLACNKPCKAKNLVTLEKGGTGFSGHDDNLEATSFKHVGGGTGMGLARPTTKL
jgi:nitric oxide synthase-interacting protein